MSGAGSVGQAVEKRRGRREPGQTGVCWTRGSGGPGMGRGRGTSDGNEVGGGGSVLDGAGGGGLA